MEVVLFLASTIVFLYSVFIMLLISGFYKISEEYYGIEYAVNEFSIVVAFRNEEDSITKLISSLFALDYPLHKFEVVFVDDHSEDSSFNLVDTLLKDAKIRAKVVKLPDDKTGKKSALAYGISQSVHPWILTTDADCSVNSMWLMLFDQKIQGEESVMIAGPININFEGYSFLKLFQQFDLAAMMGTTIGGFGLGRPFLSNGANLAFKKSVFNEVNGYDGNMEIASGDDMFLLEKVFKKYPDKVKYIKACGAIVTTEYVDNYKQFIHQRVRWASKSTNYNSKFVIFAGFLVGVSTVLMLFLLTLAVVGVNIEKALPFIIMKFLADFWMIIISSKFLRNTKKLYLYPVIAIVYPFYVVIIAVLSQMMTFEWKGRSVKR